MLRKLMSLFGLALLSVLVSACNMRARIHFNLDEQSSTANKLSVNGSTAVEGQNLLFTVGLDQAASQDIVFSWATTNGGTATPVTDFTPQSATATIPTGSSQVTLTISTVDDALYESDETVEISISSVQGAQLKANLTNAVPGRALGTLTDNDSPPSVEFTSASQNVSENVGSATVPLQLSTISGAPMGVAYSVSGTATGGGADYTFASGAISIPAGQTSAELVIPIIDDALAESTETIVVTLTSVTGGTLGSTTVHTVSILDNDFALSISNATVAESAGSVTLSVSVDDTPSQDITFSYATSNGTATAGSDYTAQSGTATIASGANSTTLVVPITNDSVSCEGDETFTVTISSPSLGTISSASATTTITDDDTPTLTMNNIYLVPGATADFEPTLSSTCPTDLTLSYSTTNGTAVAPADYTSATAATATIPAGSLSTTISLNTTSQTIASSKLFTLAVTHSGGRVSGAPSATGTLLPPSFSYDLTSSLPAGLTFSRASTATYFDASGVMQTAATNAPRFDHDEMGNPLGLLVEEERTNIFLNSEQFDTWSRNSLTVTPNTGTDLKGTATADRLLETVDNDSHLIETSLAGVGLDDFVTFSLFLKPNGRTNIAIQLTDGTSSLWTEAQISGNVNNNWTTGAASSSASSLTSVGNGWYRLSVTGNLNGVAGGTLQIYTFFVSDTGDYSYVGDPAKGFYFWGAQLEAGSGATSYIATSGSPVTRSDDMLETSSVSWYNPSNGTYVIKSHLPIASGYQTLFSSSNGTANDEVYVSYNSYTSNFGYQVTRSSAVQTSNGTLDWMQTPGTRGLAVSYNLGLFAVGVNGGIADVTTSGNVPATATSVKLGRSPDNSNPLNGHILHFAYYNRALTQSSLGLLSNQ